MAGVNVSREALTGIRRTLNQFKIEIADVPFSMETGARQMQSECESAILQVKDEVSQLQQQISSKRAALKTLQDHLAIARGQLTDTEAARKDTERSLAGIERERIACERELSHLRATLSYGDENEQGQCRQAVFAAESRLAVLKEHECGAAMELQNLERMIQKLNADIKEAEADIKRTESEIRALETALFRKEGKLSRLNTAYSSLQSELSAFTSSVRRFSQRALEQTLDGIAGVDQCIQYIDDYLATNL